jgi:hypothetical protein
MSRPVLDKLDYYDILGIVIPGTLAAYWIPICFPQVVTIATGAALPEPIDIIAFVALAFFLGHVLQGVAGAIEPMLFRTWGGRPSDRALREGLGDWYLPRDAALRIRTKLASEVGAGASDRSLFLRAMSLANTFPGSRAQAFNSLYAYFRSAVVLLLSAIGLILASAKWGAAARWPAVWIVVIVGALVILLILAWFRAKQRALYYVREILCVAERAIDQSGKDDDKRADACGAGGEK